MTPKEELEQLHAQEREIEKKIQAHYAASLAAPEAEKVCPDFMAAMCAEPAGFIEYPITVSGIAYRARKPVEQGMRKAGSFVAIRPAGEEHKGKTFLGVYLGDIATSAGAFYHRETGVLEVGLSMHNPAIWVPDLTRIVFGMESWWGLLKKPEDMKQITDADINDVWYVRALKALGG